MSDQERLDRLEAEGLALHTPEFERDIAETMTEREREARHARILERREQLRRDIGPVAESIGRSPDLRDALTPQEVVFLLDMADLATNGRNLALDGIRRRVVLAFNTAGSRGEWDEKALLAAAEARDREASNG